MTNLLTLVIRVVAQFVKLVCAYLPFLIPFVLQDLVPA